LWKKKKMDDDSDNEVKDRLVCFRLNSLL
jgi:hypothetical protein